MDTNDFLGSFAQENVSFTTQIVKSTSVGDNFWTVIVFVESDRFVDATGADWETAPGLPTCKVLVVNADTYSQYTSGLLASWLYDLFCNGFTGNCILAAPCASTVAPTITYDQVTPIGSEDPSAEGWYEYDEGTQTYSASADTTVDASKTYYKQVSTPGFVAAMEEAYEILKPYAYHKTVCAGATDAVPASIAVSLAKKCMADEYLSGAPLLPVLNPTLESDALYKPLKDANADAFMGWHSDSTRNVALYSLGLALAAKNGSQTAVGNAMDMTKSTNITASNNGVNPTPGQKSTLKSAYVQYMKTVGDNSGSVAAETDKTILGKVYAAYWILAYVTYMTKVGIAQKITERNFFKNSANYRQLVGVMTGYIDLFKDAGLLENVVYNVPEFQNLPESDASDTITIQDAWAADYVNHLRRAKISGNLYINA